VENIWLLMGYSLVRSNYQLEGAEQNFFIRGSGNKSMMPYNDIGSSGPFLTVPDNSLGSSSPLLIPVNEK
jgi:hypothetical protein